MSFAFLFPGQGSQSVRMVHELASEYVEVKETFKEASDVLSRDLWKLVEKGPQGELNLTVNAQPAMLTSSVAMWRIWNNLSDCLPSWMAGHSLGEYSALTCAGALKFRNALMLVQKRAELMQEAVPAGSGAMAAVIGPDDREIAAFCRTFSARADGVVEAVNFNTQNQTVVAGHKAAVKAFIKEITRNNSCKAVMLPVSVPSHCSLMKGAAQKFAEYLSEVSVKMPDIPMLHNVDAAVRKDPESIRQVLAEQLYRPVRWLDVIKNISDEGVEYFVEMGPGRVLAGLVRRIDKAFTALNLETPASFHKTLTVIDSYEPSGEYDETN